MVDQDNGLRRGKTQGQIIYEMMTQGIPKAPTEGGICWGCYEEALFNAQEVNWVHKKTGLVKSDTPHPHEAEVHVVADGLFSPPRIENPPKRPLID